MTLIRSAAVFASTAVLGLSLVAGGCTGDDAGRNNDRGRVDRTGPVLPPPKQLNKETAEEKLRMAEEAERSGNYSRALENYEQLRAYPQPSRPDDLDARIERVERMMKR